MAEEKKITLDGAEVTEEKLQEAKNNNAVRIIESAPGQFKTLQKLNNNNDK